MANDKPPEQLSPRLLQALKSRADIAELIQNTAMMRYWQRVFFRDKTTAALERAKKFEKLVDAGLDIVWPSDERNNQSKLF